LAIQIRRRARVDSSILFPGGHKLVSFAPICIILLQKFNFIFHQDHLRLHPIDFALDVSLKCVESGAQLPDRIVEASDELYELLHLRAAALVVLWALVWLRLFAVLGIELGSRLWGKLEVAASLERILVGKWRLGWLLIWVVFYYFY
jgi:hypothetical protein